MVSGRRSPIRLDRVTTGRDAVNVPEGFCRFLLRPEREEHSPVRGPGFAGSVQMSVHRLLTSLIASGLIWPDAQDILVQKSFLMHQPFGQGHVIAFAEEPNYRAFTEATMLLFMNAVLLGPGY